MNDTVGIVGAGPFGTALAVLVGRGGCNALLWSQSGAVVDEINQRRSNATRLPGVELPATVRATSDPAALAAGARLIVLAVASTDVLGRARTLGELLGPAHLVVHAVGALAPGDLRVSELLRQETSVLRLGALAGPALPADLIAGQFASMVVASRFAEVVSEVRRLVASPPALRIYGGSDLIGVELASALSGAYTLALGMSDALGVGAGPRAVLITRMVAEGARLCAAAGGEERTFTGLSGLGNILVRSSSASAEHSSDYRLGLALGRGDRPTDADVTEGARGAAVGARLATSLQVRSPVLEAVAAVIAGELSPRAAAAAAADSVAAEE